MLQPLPLAEWAIEAGLKSLTARRLLSVAGEPRANRFRVEDIEALLMFLQKPCKNRSGRALAYLREIARRSYRHNLGFVKIPVLENASGDKVVLHLYACTRDAVSRDIHDHFFDMRSYIVRGSFRSHEMLASESGTPYRKLAMASGHNGAFALSDAGIENLHARQAVMVRPGDDYFLPAGHVHWIEAKPNTISIVAKSRRRPVENRIFVNKSALKAMKFCPEFLTEGQLSEILGGLQT